MRRRCEECGGSGRRAGHATSPYDCADVECPDCGGEGEWEEEDESDG
jgi:DnaJ-class molecular chaperone